MSLQVAEELMQLFRLGIVHADVKWHNVLVQLHPTKKTITRVSLTDFGTLTCLGKSDAVPIR
jgi:RIO-like serine/threonine protein kinase